MDHETPADMHGKTEKLAKKKELRNRWLPVIAAFTVLAGVVFYLLTAGDSIDVSRAKEIPPLPVISVETLSVRAEEAEVAAFAEVRPRWSTELRAAVSGRVVEIRESALAGEQVAEGTTLIKLEDSEYRANLAMAESALQQARLVLRKAKINSDVARSEYRQIGNKPLNDLALHLPELKIAEGEVRAAEEKLKVARRQLADTVIRAPFSSFIVERFVSPGQSVNIGDRLIKLVDDSVFELTVKLDSKDWELLQQPVAGLEAQLFDQSGIHLGRAKIRQGGGFLDEKTRLHCLFLEVSREMTQQLLSGDFVRVLLPGQNVTAALNIPASALTQEGYVWFLDDDSRLQRISPQVLFRRDHRIIIEAPRGSEEWRVATTPLVSFLAGQQVQGQKREL